VALIEGALNLKKKSEFLITHYKRITLGGYDLPLLKAERLRNITQIISLPHKGAEGGAPVWGSEFTTKAATLKGNLADFAARLKVKIRDLTGD
jgi:hypothetical protein